MKEDRFFNRFFFVVTVISCIFFTLLAVDGIFFTDRVGWTVFYSGMAIFYGVASFFFFREIKKDLRIRKLQNKP